MNVLGRLLASLTTVATFVGAVAVILMIVHITVDVILRNVFLMSVPATGGIVANYYMAAVSFLPVALAAKLDQHIAVDIVFNRLPQRVQVWNLQAVRLLVAVVAGAAAYGFLLDAVQKYQLGSYVLEMNVRIPNWPGYFMLPIGFGLWSALNLYKIAVFLTGAEDQLGTPRDAAL